MLYSILFLVVLMLCLWGWWSIVVNRGSGKLFRGNIPIFGYLHKFYGDSESLWHLVRTMATECTEAGGVARFILGMQTYYVITDPEDLMTASNLCLKKHFSYDFAKSWLGDGLVTSSTAVWKRHRKLLSPAFTLQILHGFFDIFNSQSRELVQDLSEEVGKGNFDISGHFRRIALITLSHTAFGLSSSGDKSMFRKYSSAVDEALDLIVSRFQKVWLQSDLLYKLSGLKKKEDELVKVLNEMSNKVIQEKKAAIKCDKNNEDDCGQTSARKYKAFLDILLSGDNVLTDKEIREEVDTAIVAGFDTSSWLLTYVCAALGTYKSVQDKLYDEITTVFGDSDRDVDKEDLLKLVYTEAVIKETLRVFPIVPVVLRTAEANVQLKNIRIRSGDHVALSIYGMNRHPVWGPDADQFRPERWLDPAALPNAFGGFSVGKRSCIGKTYAMISMNITLVHILRRYHFSGDITTLRQKMEFIMKPICGHTISITERESLHRSDRIRSQAQ